MAVVRKFCTEELVVELTRNQPWLCGLAALGAQGSASAAYMAERRESVRRE